MSGDAQIPVPRQHRPLTRILPRVIGESTLTGFVAMALLLLATPAGAEATRVGRVILLAAGAGLGAIAGAVLAGVIWMRGRMAYKRAGGPMTPPVDPDAPPRPGEGH